MGEHTSNELAYKKGYEAGYRDGKDRVMGDIAFHKLLERPPERSREELEYLMQSPVVLIKDTESINQIYPYSRWIPVTERLPNHWEDVLVRLQCGDCVVAVRSGLIWRVRWNNTLLDREPTHWMPLPEPPKGE